jgi:hypothetical protein
VPEMPSPRTARVPAHGGWPRRFPIAQAPSPPLQAVILAAAARRALDGAASRHAETAYDVALTVWAWDEAVRGTNWFRRLLGLCSLAHVAGRVRARVAARRRLP